MVTNLKKGKKIRALCYRLIAVGALITAIASGIMGREALYNVAEYGIGVYSGRLADLPEFRRHMAILYNKAMIAYAGIGDNQGIPLQSNYAEAYCEQSLKEFKQMVAKSADDIIYYVETADGMEYTNISYPLFSKDYTQVLLPEDVELCYYWNGTMDTTQFFGQTYKKESVTDPAENYYSAQYQPNGEHARKMKLVLAVKKNCGTMGMNDLERKAERYQEVLMIFTASVVVFLFFGFLSLCTCKAAKQGREDYGKWAGKVWVEIKLILIALAIVPLVAYDLAAFGSSLNVRMRTYDMLWFYFLIGFLWYLLCVDIRQNKWAVFTRSLPGACVRTVTEFVGSKPWYRRAKALSTGMLIGGIMLITGGVCLVSVKYSVRFFMNGQVEPVLITCGAILIPVGILLIFGHMKQEELLKDTAAIARKLSEMREGKINVPLEVPEHSLLAQAAEDLNELESGIEKAVEEQNRSNRMRVELITNVSHDLKTPLTSIINYADLLCEEELSETAAEYASALQGKAYRLKNMVQDVFDLSKASSGNLVVENAVIDLVKLIKQTLADMDERIQESTLTFKLNISKEPLPIEADGEKLYRVFQNLFVNALQYSLENSRVHVQLLEEDGFAVAKVKNTSKMELNFKPEEIVERFVRADSSRTTEGSGLGLSIVQSFAEACGGEFMVQTDADMFTACVRFPLTQKGVVTEAVSEEAVVLEQDE